MKPFSLSRACAALIAGLAASGSVAALAAEGGRIALTEVNWGGEPEGGIAMIDDADNPTIRRLTNPPQDVHAVDFAPSWSPSGKQLVFHRSSMSDNEAYGIYRVNVDGSNLKRLVGSPSDFIGPPKWGPRSTNLIAFVSDSAANSICASVMSPDGSNRRDVLCPKGSDGTPRQIHELQWFPDGKHLLVCTARPGYPSNVRKVEVATGKARLLASLDLCPSRISISPNGKQLALEDNEAVHILDVATNARRFLTAGTSPVFSADSKKIAFQKKVIADRFYPLVVIDADGSNARQITPPQADGRYSAYTPIEWSADGSEVLVNSAVDYGDDFFSYPTGIVRVDDGSFRSLTSARVHSLTHPNPWFEDEDAAIALTNGVTRRNLIGRQGEEKLYKLVVPAGMPKLQVTTSGGSGDVSLYVSLNKAPSPDDAQYWSTHGGTNNEAIGIAPAAAGTYYIKVIGEQAYSGVNLRACYTP